jgi:hypothetical protein
MMKYFLLLLPLTFQPRRYQTLLLPQDICVALPTEPSAIQQEMSNTAPSEVFSSSFDTPNAPAMCPDLGEQPNISRPPNPPPQTHVMLTRSRNNISKPTRKYHDFITNGSTHALLAGTDPSKNEPTCYSEATRFPEWRTTMNLEFTALMHNGSCPTTSNNESSWVQIGLQNQKKI